MGFSGDVPWWIVLLGLEFPVITAMIDCWTRPEDHFEKGEADRRAWKGWLIVAVVTAPVLLGFGVLIGYYYAVVRRNTPGSPG